MTTVRDVITYALRLGRVIGSGRNPTAREAADGLVAFQSMIDSMVTGGTFGRLTDVYLESDDTAEEGKRYLLAEDVTLTIPDLIEGTGSDYGSEGSTSQRPPYDLSIIEYVDSEGERTVKLYDRTEWVDLLGLELDTDAPLACRGAMGLAALLASSEAFLAIFGDTDLSPRVERLAGDFRRQIAAKPGSTRADRTADYF